MTDRTREIPADSMLAGTAGQRFSRGFKYPFKGIRYLARHQDLWGWVAVPAVINLSFFTVGVVSSWLVAPQMLATVWARPAEGAALFGWVVLAWLLRLGLAAIVGMGVYLLASILSAPFNEVISEKVEQLELGDADQAFGWKVFIRDTTTSVVHSLGALAMYVGVMVPLILINLLPGIGSVIFTIASWTISAFFVAREMLDGVTSRRQMGFGAKIQLVRDHKALMGGLGTGTNLLLWIPLLNFLCLPVAVVGATLLYCDLEREGLVPARRRLTGP